MIQLKSRQDIEYIKEAGLILAETVKALKKEVREGVTTAELDELARQIITKYKATPAFLGYHGYPAAICISVNEEVIHGIPAKRKLKEGDIVSIDLGVDFRGYIADAALTLPVAKISEEDSRLLKTTEECLYLGIEKAKCGQRLQEISKAIYDHAQKAGFEVVREYCGHGVGFALHEEPQVYNYPGSGPNPKLKEGMVLAIEPMLNAGSWRVEVLKDKWTVVTKDKRNSAHFEHTIAIFEDHTEILTQW